MRIGFFILVLSAFALSQISWASDTRTIGIFASSEVFDQFGDVIAVVSVDGKSYEVFRGLVVNSASDSESDSFMATVITVPSSFKSISSFFVLHSGSTVYRTPLTTILSSEEPFVLSELRKENETNRKIKTRLHKELARKDTEARMLREDIDLYVDLGRIVDVREQRKKLESSLASFDQEEILLREVLASVRLRGTSHSLRAQEQSLVRGISMLNVASDKVKRDLRVSRSLVDGENDER